MRRLLIIVAAALAFSALSGVAAYQALPRGEDNAARWQEIAWPFPRDGWPAGRAFRCASCGEAELYVRPKIGFCNCDTGVADDEEVDRVADLDLISARFAPLAGPICPAGRGLTILRWRTARATSRSVLRCRIAATSWSRSCRAKQAQSNCGARRCSFWNRRSCIAGSWPGWASGRSLECGFHPLFRRA